METTKLKNIILTTNMLDAKNITENFIHLSGDNNIGDIHISSLINIGTENHIYSNGSMAIGQKCVAGAKICRIYFIDSDKKLYLDSDVNVNEIDIGTNKNTIVLNTNYTNKGSVVEVGTIETPFTKYPRATKYVKMSSLTPNVRFGTYIDENTFKCNNGDIVHARDTHMVDSFLGIDLATQQTYKYSGKTDTVANSIIEFNTATSDGTGNYIQFTDYPEIGDNTTKLASLNIAEGYESKAYGLYSHAEGRHGVANGKYSHVEGSICYSDYCGHAQNRECSCFGYDSFAGGFRSTANGGNCYPSFAFGRYSDAIKQNSFVLGSAVSAIHANTIVFSCLSGNATGTERVISNRDGAFSVYNKDGADGFYINGQTLKELINYYAGAIVDEFKIEQNIPGFYKNGTIVTSADILDYDEDEKSVSYALRKSTDPTYTKLIAKNLSVILDQQKPASGNPISGFASYSKLKDVYADNAVSIGQYAFAYSTELSNFYGPKVKHIKGYAFQQTNKLKTIDLPSCEKLDNYAFGNSAIEQLSAKNLSSFSGVSFSGSRTINKLYVDNEKYYSIDNGEFVITRDEIPTIWFMSKAKTNISTDISCNLANHLLYNSANLKELHIKNVQNIGTESFQSTRDIMSVEIDNVLKFGQRSFLGCNKLSCVSLVNRDPTLYATIPTLPKELNTFDQSTAVNDHYILPQLSIFVPDAMHESFKTAPNWSSNVSCYNVGMVPMYSFVHKASEM